MSDNCPCGGKRSVGWHAYNNVEVCRASKDRKNARIRDLRAETAKSRPKKIEVQEDCPCKGEKGVNWHRYRNIKSCLAARKERKETESDVQRIWVNGKSIKIRWTPGTSILVPEIDPL